MTPERILEICKSRGEMDFLDRIDNVLIYGNTDVRFLRWPIYELYLKQIGFTEEPPKAIKYEFETTYRVTDNKKLSVAPIKPTPLGFGIEERFIDEITLEDVVTMTACLPEGEKVTDYWPNATNIKIK